MSFLSKVSRIAKPGMFGAVLVGIAITAAATYTAKLSMELDSTLDAVEKTRLEIDELETHRATILNDIEGIARYRDDMLSDMRQRMEADIASGSYDDAVLGRHLTLLGVPEPKASATAETSAKADVGIAKPVKGKSNVNV